MNQPEDPQDARPPRKDEGPSQQDIDRSWSDVSGGGKSGGWTDRWWQILITVVGIVIVGSLVITVLPFRSRSANVQPTESGKRDCGARHRRPHDIRTRRQD